MDITVFTPTYNRAYLLERLFRSLKKQNDKLFEWIIIDDGSDDNTEEVVAKFSDASFPIRYFKQINSGKHIAINKGAKLAEGNLFFIVDSDDYLVEGALDYIVQEWSKISNNMMYAGIVPNRAFDLENAIGSPRYMQTDCNPIEFRYFYRELGDKAELVRTSLFIQNPFPETPGEKFCPEALFFNRLVNYKLRYINKNLYICNYLPDGLTAKIFKIRKESPVNTCISYTELCKLDIPYSQRLKAAINFYRFKRYTTSYVVPPSNNLIFNAVAGSLAYLYYILQDRHK